MRWPESLYAQASTRTLSAAALVMQVFTRRRLWPLWAAMGWHETTNAVVVYANVTWGIVAAEALLAELSLVSVGILWGTWCAERQTELFV